MVQVNNANNDVQLQQGLQGSNQLTPQQKALEQAKAGLEANKSLDGSTRQVISTILASYASFGVDVSKYSDLSYECLARINQNQHETIMTMLEDWSVFLQQQAKLDKEAANRSAETAREVMTYINSQDFVKITNSKGELVKDRRVIARMSPEQKRMLNLARTYNSIISTISAPVTTTVVAKSNSIISDGSERAPITGAQMNPNRVCLTPPSDNIGVSTTITGNQIN